MNPDDEVGWKRIVNMPKRGVGDTSVRKVEAYAQGAEVRVPRGAARGAAAGVTGRALGGIRDLLEVMSELERAAAELGVCGCARGDARPDRLPRRARGRAHDRGAGPDREPERARRRRARLRRAPRRRRPLGRSSGSPASRRSPSRRRGLARVQAFLEAVSLVTDLDEVPRRGVDRHADDAAHREGPRVPGRVPHRDGGRDLPAHALGR